MYTKEFYHTKADAYEQALTTAGENGIIKDDYCTASNFDYISRDAINDDRDGDCHAFWTYTDDGELVGVYAYAE